MIIAIEGHDGVGKTSLALQLSKKLKYEYVKHPECKLYDISENDYRKISEKVINYNNSLLTAMFLSIGDNYALEYYKNKNVILDRHALLNYYWNGNKVSEFIFKNSIKNFGKPDFTILLTATPEIRKTRLLKRNPHDSDLQNEIILNADEKKLIQYIKKYRLKHLIIDTSFLSQNEVFEIAFNTIKYKLDL